MDIEEVRRWLEEGDEWNAVDLLAQCEFVHDYVDTGFPFDGGPEIDILELNIRAPRRILDRVAVDLKPDGNAIEKAVAEIASAQHCWVRDIHWVPLLGKPASSACDDDVERACSKFDSVHVRSAWLNARRRRDQDPAGAITAAKTLLEAVCKHILKADGVDYAKNARLPDLYHLVAKHLELAPGQHVHKIAKRVLGNCHAVVQGIGSLRNELGDAHATDPDMALPTAEYAELAVNLAGTMATFLTKCWERRKEDKEEAEEKVSG